MEQKSQPNPDQGKEEAINSAEEMSRATNVSNDDLLKMAIKNLK